MLSCPEALTEKRGLRLAGALRYGAEPRFCEVLEAGQGGDPDSKLALLEAVIDETEKQPRHVRCGGRPKVDVPKLG